MQYQLLQVPSIKPTFRYPGSKVPATQKILSLVPKGTKRVVSPFIGGGAIELALSANGKQVFAYDKQVDLVNCWKHIIQDGDKLAIWCRKTLLEKSRDELRQIFTSNYDGFDDFERAGYHWLHMSLTYRGILTNGAHICYYDIVNGNAMYRTSQGIRSSLLTRFDRLETFYSPNLSVDYGDFEDTLDKHKDLFAYCDPPYPEAGKTLYGGSREYSSGFDHERLARVLDKREAPFLLSYNDKELIRELYPQDKYLWTYQDWYQRTSINRVVTDEVLIQKREFL